MSRWWLLATLLATGLIPLGLLSYFAVDLGGRAVDRRVKENLTTSASISALYFREELRGLAEVDTSFATRPSLVEALAGGDKSRYDRSFIRGTLEQLSRVRPGIGTAFLADSKGRLVDIVPATPSIVGKSFAFRDWYRGVTRTGRAYVSQAYESQAVGHPLVVAVAAPIREPSGRRIGIIVAAYRLDTIQAFAAAFARAQGVSLTITDQRGGLVADARRRAKPLSPRRADPRVAAALGGRSGIAESGRGGDSVLSAYAPVPGIGWTVIAEIPSSRAFAAVHDLRRTVTLIAALLAVLLCGGIALLSRVLRLRQVAESRTQTVLDATVDGIQLTDLAGRPVLSNATYDRLIGGIRGVPEEPRSPEGVEVTASLLTRPDQFRAYAALIANDPEYEGIHEFELAESGRSFKVFTAPARDARRKLLGRITTLREVTSEREAERMKTELLATVSHELRTPLASILGFAELLVHRELDAETRGGYLETIYREAGRLTSLINDFLDLQRIEEGRFTLALEPFDLTEALEEQVQTFAGQSNAHEIRLAAPGESFEVVGERDRVAQVIANLLSNAIKYSPSGGPVQVSTERQNGSVRVTVSDSGLGIPAVQQPRLFTKFFRVDSSDTREIGGTGLGLALCREIVEAHGGRIGFDSVEGEGSTFWFELPAAGAPIDPTAGNGSRGRVLVVEDDRAAASLFVAQLSEDGLAVIVAETGEEGLALAQADPPDLVCLDITLAGELDGWEVLTRLKENSATANLPVVICTAGNGRDRAATLGAADFLTKPFSGKRLREAVQRLLPSDRGSVLVVDDDPSVRRLVVATLERDGVELREAANGEEALTSVAAARPDVIVLDLVMPVLDGFGVLERLQADADTRTIPVLVLTARRLSAEERRHLHARANALLEKSFFSADELRTLVRNTLSADYG